MEIRSRPVPWGPAWSTNLNTSKYMKKINEQFRKHRLGELRCLRYVRRRKAVFATSLTTLVLCFYGMLLLAITFLALSFVGLALMAKSLQ